MTSVLTTFPHRAEFEKAKRALDGLRLSYGVISPEPAFRLVGVPALLMDAEVESLLLQRYAGDLVCSGWVDALASEPQAPQSAPPEYEEDIFGTASISVLARCVADRTKIRLIAQISGDLTGVFPYLNSEMKTACYNPRGPNLSFMDSYRMVSLYPRRVTIAKADGIVDAWRTLEMIRCRANDVWLRRSQIEPSYEMRRKPPVLEIFQRLPRTNCRACGELTCLAFAIRLYEGLASPGECRPVLDGPFERLAEPLAQICKGFGVYS